MLRFIPEYRSSHSAGLLRGLLGSSRRFVLFGTTGLAFTASLALITLGPPHLDRTALVLGFWLAPLLGLVLLETEILRAAGMMISAYGPLYVLRRLLFLGSIGALVMLSAPISPVVALMLAAIALIAVLTIQRRSIRSVFRNQLAEAQPRRNVRFWISVALPLLLSKSFLLIISKTDLFVIGALVDAREVGLYNAALQTAHAVTLFSFAVDAVAAPAVSSHHAKGRTALQELASQMAHWYFWPALGIGIALVPLSSLILGFFGPDFVGARREMMILLVGLLVNAGTGLQTYLLQLTGHERLCARVYGWSALLNVFMNCIGVFLLGSLGAALATTLSMIVWNVWIYRLVTTHTGVYPSILTACARALKKSPAS